MRGKIFLSGLILLILFSVSVVSSEDFGYNLLEPGKNLEPGFNNDTAFVNKSQFAEIWITTEGNLDDVSDILHSDLSNLAWSVAGHIFDTDLDIGGFTFRGLFNWTSTDNWNTFTGSSLTFNKSKLDIIYYNATSVDVVVGTLDGGDVEDTWVFDKVSINISEANAEPGLDIRINFTGVDDFNQLILRFKTNPNKEHLVSIQLWDFVNSVWEDHDFYIEVNNWDNPYIPIWDSLLHVGTGANDGDVWVRIYLADRGKTTHVHYYDFAQLSLGTGTFSSIEADPLSYHKDENINADNFNATFANLNVTGTSYLGDIILDVENITASYYCDSSNCWNLTLMNFTWAFNHTKAVQDSWWNDFTSTYNTTYAGLINNASYLSTYNITYAGSVNNASYLSTYNVTYEGFTTNVSINYTLETYNLWDSVWSAQATIWDSIFNNTFDGRDRFYNWSDGAGATDNFSTTGNANIGGTVILPITSSTVGQIIQDGNRIFHTFRDSGSADKHNVFIGKNAGNFVLSHAGGSTYRSTGNIGIGHDVLQSLTLGFYNVALGLFAGKTITSGGDNVILGAYAGGQITTGHGNFALGREALYGITTGSNNVAIGKYALKGANFGNSIGIGYYAGKYETAGSKLFIDSLDRGSEANGRTKSLIYGVFNADPVSQTLRINADLEVSESVVIGSSPSANATLLTVYGNITASNFIDLTPVDLKTGSQALDSIRAIKNKRGQIDHDSLSEFVQADVPLFNKILIDVVCKNITELVFCEGVEIGEEEKMCEETYERCDEIYEKKIVGYLEGRNIGNQLSELINAYLYSDEEIQSLKQENQRIKDCAINNLEYDKYRECILA